MRVLIVDNHDSYTYNLFQLIAEVVGTEPTVLANDDPALAGLDLRAFDAAVVSPGPGTPRRPGDIGGVPRLLDAPWLPVLGVCLGHQAIAHLGGGDVTSAPLPRHGHLTRIRHDAAGLFTGLPQDFTAVRYHSLRVADPLPADLTVTARAEDGVVMGLTHRSLPRWGVQFHPESIASEHGAVLIANFARLARRWCGGGASSPPIGTARVAPVTETPPAPRQSAATGDETRRSTAPRSQAPVEATGRPPGPLVFRVLEDAPATDAVFHALYARAPYSFWLDSSRVGNTARFSFLGDASGARGEVLTYRVGTGSVRVETAGNTYTEPGTIFDVLQDRVATVPTAHPVLPFDFTGGYVGYFGYELKADCGGAAVHRSRTPDSAWLRCDRFVAIDHLEGRCYLVAADGDTAWLDHVADVLTGLPAAPDLPDGVPAVEPEPLLERHRAGYLADVKECLAQLTAGESYEICLTNRLRLSAPADGFSFYRRLRRASPAPYAALVRMGGLTVHSASPERFLRVDGEGWLESRPIKGTAPRHPDPVEDARLRDELRTSAKTRAENLMIVDLLRNDLGRVSEVGTVSVPEFMYTESYATVHQLVSTVRGRLRTGVSPVAAIRACFPAGSMTGAPKRRTMEILDRVESSARGVYSGALGYLSYSGAADLSVVIRSAVSTHGGMEVGAGGAIVLDSDPAEEYEEMLLKARVPLRGLGGG
ncbi:aminodeoxychorismate synthase component I [Nocardiopsis ansamitocini]|uniref:aminodeoxychorismate synthase n=1 Tax=Nocardiopsis ansamitocini TaxID=1670832 RepID=A0A9W6UH37_9ACTN|nr:aminodeoxychorismate synthase component I [Nocardiopsis ansamitocini]GLU48421.1 aminodeoxychorismate synthase, component I [Nocardiopsis ansamitocini]